MCNYMYHGHCSTKCGRKMTYDFCPLFSSLSQTTPIVSRLSKRGYSNDVFNTAYCFTRPILHFVVLWRSLSLVVSLYRSWVIYIDPNYMINFKKYPSFFGPTNIWIWAGQNLGSIPALNKVWNMDINFETEICDVKIRWEF